LAMRKVRNGFELHSGRCKSDARAVLKEKGVTNPTEAHLKKAMDKVEE